MPNEMSYWIDRVLREEAERREQGLETTIGILSATDTSNVAEPDEDLTYEAVLDAIRALCEATPRPRYYDAAMAHWLAEARVREWQILDESSDDDRQRWANELETTPYQGDDSGGGLSSVELLEAIGEAVTEWKDVRDGE